MMRVNLFTNYEGIQAYNAGERFEACTDRQSRTADDTSKKRDFIYSIYVRSAEIRSESKFGFVMVKKYSFAK